MKAIFLFAGLLFFNVLNAQNLKTSGDQSPAIIAQNFSAVYGVRADAIVALLKVYEKDGLSPADRKNRTESLLKKYQQAPEKKKGAALLSEATKVKLGLTTSPELTNALDWDLFAQKNGLSTSGDQSPAVVASGDVYIWYGIPPKTLQALVGRLEEDKTTSEELQKRLDAQVEQFRSLEKELALRADYDSIAKQARQLLNEGKINEAEKLMEEDFEQGEKRQAYKAYELGSVKALNLKYNEAAKYFQIAVDRDPNNSEYLLYYANNENARAHYDKAIEYYQKALAIDTVVFKTNPEKAAQLYNNLGTAWNEKSNFNNAITFFEKALAIDSIVFGKSHPILAIRYNNLGEAYHNKGEFNHAIALFEKALVIDSLAFGKNGSAVAREYNNIGAAWRQKGDYEHAIDFYKKALAIDSINLKKDQPKLATRYNNLGETYYQKGNCDQAIALYEKALAIDAVAFGQNHPNVAVQYNNLGEAYRQKGNYDQAIIFSGKALGIDSIVFGKNHPAVARDYNNIGGSWQAKNDYDRAIAFYEKALPIDSMTFGKNHPDVAVDYNNLGASWYGKGEYDHAIAFFEKALVIDSINFDENHLKAAIRYNNLGYVYQSKGKYDRAITFYEKALAILLESLGKTHPNTMSCAQNISMAANARGLELFQEKKYAQALLYFQKGLENAEAAEDWSLSVTCLNNLGSINKRLKQYTEGLAALKKGITRAQELDQKSEKPEHAPLIRRMRYHQAGCLAGLNRKKEADTLYQQLKKEAIETNDTRLLEDLKKDGVKD